MINQDVLKYINDELAKGTSRDDIAKNLMAGGGWTMEEVVFHFGFAKATPVVAPKAPEVKIPSPVVTPTPITTPTLTPEPQKTSLPDLQSIVNNITAIPLTTEKPVSPTISTVQTQSGISTPQVLTSPISMKAVRPRETSPVYKILALTFAGALLIVGAGFAYKYYLNFQHVVVTPTSITTPVTTQVPTPAPASSTSTITAKNSNVDIKGWIPLSELINKKIKFVLPALPDNTATSTLYLLYGSDGQQTAFVTDKSRVWYLKINRDWSGHWVLSSYGIEIELIDGADVATLELVGKGYVKDKHRVYYETYSLITLADADSATFQLLGESGAKDKNRVWFRSTIIEGADSATFQFLDIYYAKDKNNVYFLKQEEAGDILVAWFTVLTGADLNSFVSIGDYYAKDKSHVYRYGEVVGGVNPVNCTAEKIEGCKTK
jgi:hypothetical protein